MNLADSIRKIIVIAPSLLFAITLHEMMHGWVADKLGDKTARMLGRISLNPAKHIDVFGTIVLPIVMFITSSMAGGAFLFGWAKPVPINYRNLANPKRDMALVAIAGPAANFVMALICAAIVKLVYLAATTGFINGPWLQATAVYLVAAGEAGILINIILLVLNLIPIPPLDGSRVVSSLLPSRLSVAYNRLEPYGIWILLGLLFLGILSKLMHTPVYYLVNLIKSWFGIV